MYIMYMIFFLVAILVSVAFFTLLERKILGYVHFRVGPNKSISQGIGQPFTDLIKLFSKLDYNFSYTNLLYFMLSPFMMVMLAVIIWVSFCHTGNSNNLKYFFFVLMVINALLTFFFLFPGWSSGSFFSSLGGYRASAQCISYEALFFFCVIILIFLGFSFNPMSLKMFSYVFSNFLVYSLLFAPWLIAIMAESNRTPFDFAEGESELVSGFNTEYGSGMFSIIFLSEYMSMLFYSYLTSFVLFGNSSMALYMFFLMLLIYVWIRTSFPRLRYDKLMVLSWKSMMFIVTGVLLLYTLFYFF